MNYLRPYDAELSCLSASSLTLVREKKRYAIFGSQPTAILGRSLFSMECHNDEAFHVFFFFFFSTADMFKLGKIRRHHWKKRLKLVTLPILKMICSVSLLH